MPSQAGSRASPTPALIPATPGTKTRICCPITRSQDELAEVEGERPVCRLAWSQIEGSRLILHEVQPTIASASGLRAIEFMYIDFTPSLICLPSPQSFRADKLKAQQRRNILSWKNQLWQICDKSQSSVHLCFTGVVRDETFILSSWIFTLGTLSFPQDGSNGREPAVLCCPEAQSHQLHSRSLEMQTLSRGCWAGIPVFLF